MFLDPEQVRLSHVSRTVQPSMAWRQLLSAQAFDDAARAITQWPDYKATPLHQLHELAKSLGVTQIAYKDESKRFEVGSFKALGAPYAACRALQRALRKQGSDVTLNDIASGQSAALCAQLTVASATDGNHGRALAWGASRFGANCEITIHAEVSAFRERAMAMLGANVTRIDGDYDESVRIAREQANANGWHIVSDTSWPGYTDPPTDVMSGYGLMIDEIFEQIEQPPTHVFIQGGVGGLAAAVCARLTQVFGDHAPRMIVTEPEWAACLQASARNENATTVAIENESVMAGLSCGEPSPIAWTVLSELATDFLTIADDAVGPSMRILGSPPGNDPPIVAGESAVAGLAGLAGACGDTATRDALGLSSTSRILIFGTEGDTDPEIYQQIMANP